jgi:hypothetical protein
MRPTSRIAPATGWVSGRRLTRVYHTEFDTVVGACARRLIAVAFPATEARYCAADAAEARATIAPSSCWMYVIHVHRRGPVVARVADLACGK